MNDQTKHYAKSPGESVQEILERDVVKHDESVTASSYEFLGDSDLSIDRYLSRDWHDREVEKVWKKTWQVACRVEDIEQPGDYVVYDICDDSVIVMRQPDGSIKAFVNSCLHRGNALCLDQGHVKNIRCPYHGFTWGLEGELRWVPGQWDFPHLDKEKFSLPEVRLDQWGGFVFINLDDDAEPLRDYLEILPKVVDGDALEKRYKAVHVSQVVPCNWKIVQEAFIEGYHVAETHYEKDEDGQVDENGIAAFTHDTAVQYDIWPGVKHINRLILVDGVPSQYVAHKIPSEQHIVDTLLRRVPEAMRPQLKEGDRARPALAAFNRMALSQLHKVDLSGTSDSEMLDQVQNNIFPNFTVWSTVFAPLCYRFRPYGNDPDRSIFEVWFLHPRPEDGSDVTVMKEKRLEPGEAWASVEELGVYGPIIDQDMPNLVRLTKGLKAARKPGITLGNYQEIRVRHFHKTLEEYLEG